MKDFFATAAAVLAAFVVSAIDTFIWLAIILTGVAILNGVAD